MEKNKKGETIRKIIYYGNAVFAAPCMGVGGSPSSAKTLSFKKSTIERSVSLEDLGKKGGIDIDTTDAVKAPCYRTYIPLQHGHHAPTLDVEVEGVVDDGLDEGDGGLV